MTREREDIEGITAQKRTQTSPESLRTFALMPHRASAAADRDLALERARIVVVDDDRDTAAMMRALLQIAGHEVETAHDGMAAVETVARFEPHVVLLDIGVPGMDGYAIARRLREAPHGAKLVLIALTGYSQTEHIAAMRAAGFDHHLAKPIDLNVVRRLIAQALSERAAARA
jgi:CheY-like chemotaxis protein